MRSTKSRSRSKANRNRSVGNIVNRVFDSSGPEGKVRGTPQQIIDKYNQLARDAQLSNDRVATENFQQHAEHYLRMLSEAQREQDARREQQERENRERQAERDRERAERDAQRAEANQENTAAQAPQAAPQPAQAMDAPLPGDGEQPDVFEFPGAGDEVSNLVDTPENAAPAEQAPKPARTRRTRRKPAAKGSGEQAPAEKANGDQPTSQDAPAAPKTPRKSRKTETPTAAE